MARQSFHLDGKSAFNIVHNEGKKIQSCRKKTNPIFLIEFCNATRLKIAGNQFPDFCCKLWLFLFARAWQDGKQCGN